MSGYGYVLTVFVRTSKKAHHGIAPVSQSTYLPHNAHRWLRIDEQRDFHSAGEVATAVNFGQTASVPARHLATSNLTLAGLS